MFNGIIFNKGTIKKILKRPKGINIFIKSDLKLSMRDIGISVACDGVCLTLLSFKKRSWSSIFQMKQLIDLNLILLN